MFTNRLVSNELICCRPYFEFFSETFFSKFELRLLQEV